MKKLKYSQKLINETNTFAKLIETYCNKINKEYAKNINLLLKRIAEGENLNLEDLKTKYLKTKQTIPELSNETEELTIVSKDTEEYEDTEENEEIILDKIIIDNTNYYYENKENGKVYDTLSKVVGQFKNKQIIFT
jgi:hypothetical protein